MTPDNQPRENAEQLRRALRASRRDLDRVDEETRDRRLQAIALLSGYASLLQDASSRADLPHRYSFKLVYPDGSWNVEEQELPSLPRRGDVVSFGQRRWCVRTSQSVRPRPSGKPNREFFVCAPAF